MTYMLDTNICIYVMKKRPENVLRRFQKELYSGLCISSITLAELEYGMKHSSDPVRNEQALLRFLAPMNILPFGLAAASEYGEIRAYLQSQGTPIGPLDMLIAGHARSEGMILVTNNGKEFERVPDLVLENWAE
ncbi:type II toxin-antitoxin system VapC family toxin [Colidextribacter sp. OB.20]|nr:type II toxin-antitoxin system VapC family toxin [Colidextribacter sp. OB.20]